MRVVIAGGGNLGFYLAHSMQDKDYDVTLIERDKQRCLELANELDGEVICGDGTELSVLSRADLEEADCFIAVTNSDQDNLVASQLAKKRFGCKKVIARANNPRNLEVLRRLGVDIAVSSTEIIMRLIEQEVESTGMRLLATLNRGKAAISTVTLPENSALDGRMLKEIRMPSSSLIISVLHEEKLCIPRGNTVIHSGDEITTVCFGDNQQEVLRVLSVTER